MKSKYLIVAALLGASVSSHADWVAGRDMIANEKPDGPQELLNPNSTVPEWSYGYRFALQSQSLTLFTSSEHTNSLLGIYDDMEGFTSAITVPLVLVNTGASPVVYDSGYGLLTAVNPGQLDLHPGSFNEYTVVRWTAPTSGSFAITAFWQDIDPYGGDGASGHVLVNGVQVFGQSWANGGGGTIASPLNLNLIAGDFLDFAVGANANSDYDNTSFDATITVVPEPSAILLSTIGVLVAAFRRNRNDRNG